MTVEELLAQAQALSPADRKQLAYALIDLIAADEPPRLRRLSELRGLGKADPSKAELVEDIRRKTAKDN